MSDKPNWSDPNDPAWDRPHGTAHTRESLIQLAREEVPQASERSDADLLELGVEIMRTRGYRLDNDLGDAVDRAVPDDERVTWMFFLNRDPR